MLGAFRLPAGLVHLDEQQAYRHDGQQRESQQQQGRGQADALLAIPTSLQDTFLGTDQAPVEPARTAQQSQCIIHRALPQAVAGVSPAAQDRFHRHESLRDHPDQTVHTVHLLLVGDQHGDQLKVHVQLPPCVGQGDERRGVTQFPIFLQGGLRSLDGGEHRFEHAQREVSAADRLMRPTEPLQVRVRDHEHHQQHGDRCGKKQQEGAAAVHVQVVHRAGGMMTAIHAPHGRDRHASRGRFADHLRDRCRGPSACCKGFCGRCSALRPYVSG